MNEELTIQGTTKGTETEHLNSIESRVLNIRGKQVMLDRDLAALYGVETKALNQAVKRNIERFPEDFMFQLNKEESYHIQSSTSQIDISSQSFETSTSRSQFVTMNDMKRGKNLKYLPYAFTEQGIAMLSGVLRSEKAIEVNIRIMRAFVAMRRFLLANAQIFQRIETLEIRQISTDKKLNALMDKLDEGTASNTLHLLTLRASGVAASVYTGQIKPALQKAHTLHTQQYPTDTISLRTYNSNFHDRFLIIDDAVYHIGASLKDLGKRLFAFTKMELDKSVITAQL